MVITSEMQKKKLDKYFDGSVCCMILWLNNVDLSICMSPENFEGRSVIVHRNFQGQHETLKRKHLQGKHENISHYSSLSLGSCTPYKLS